MAEGGTAGAASGTMAEGGTDAPELRVSTRGERRSFDLRVHLPDAAALAMLRTALKEDERVQMVF